jgi:hypothetical protein
MFPGDTDDAAPWVHVLLVTVRLQPVCKRAITKGLLLGLVVRTDV